MRYFKVYDLPEHVDSISVLKCTSQFEDERGRMQYQNVSITRFQDEVLPETEITPPLIKQYDDGEQHVHSFLIETDESGDPLVEDTAKKVERKPKTRASTKKAPVEDEATEEVAA
jgi:nitrogen fixation-related uncharacterized protein